MSASQIGRGGFLELSLGKDGTGKDDWKYAGAVVERTGPGIQGDKSVFHTVGWLGDDNASQTIQRFWRSDLLIQATRTPTPVYPFRSMLRAIPPRYLGNRFLLYSVEWSRIRTGRELMQCMHEAILEFYERVLPKDDVESVIQELIHLGPRILGRTINRVELAPVDDLLDTTRIPLEASDGSMVAILVLDEPLAQDVPWEARLFLKMAAWSICRITLLRTAELHNEHINSLRIGRLIVEEGLPSNTLIVHPWQISGLLRPAFHLGGDSYFYSVSENVLRFILIDAVGHGLGSTILASVCRSLWRGGAFETDLGVAVARLNRLLNEDTGPERFVAATLGYCHPDGRVEYVSCGQGPLFVVRHGEVEVLPECEPPLGMFAELDFSIQRLNLEPGEVLVAVTDGVLEWEDDSARMFGEAGVAAVLARPCHSSESVLQSIVQGLTNFWMPPSQRDDVCCLAILRTA